jgi:hypothetical protein
MYRDFNIDNPNSKNRKTINIRNYRTQDKINLQTNSGNEYWIPNGTTSIWRRKNGLGAIPDWEAVRVEGGGVSLFNGKNVNDLVQSGVITLRNN